MKIRHLDLPSGTTEGIPVLFDARWTPAQAMAVYELLNDLSAQIWRHYGPQLQQFQREDRAVEIDRDPDHAADDEEF